MPQLPGWSHAGSPFHAGEREIQERAGVRDHMETVGRRVLRNVMPDQHRDFFARLPFLILGTVDGKGQPWASAVTGTPGFASSPDAATLRVAARPHDGDPAAETLAAGADMGVLGIDFAARRRNRVNGLVAAATDEGFDLSVVQSFGNCPRYIQARDWRAVPAPERPRLVRGRWLGAADREIIAGADTLFIASAMGSARGEPSHGVDASHRGGMPGFVRVDDEYTLTMPDFAGNSYFNTLGNLQLNPRCGLLFVDFERGTTLQIAAEAEILWDGPELGQFAGAERVLRFHVLRRLRAEQALPLRWTFLDYSPFLPVALPVPPGLAAAAERQRA